jgi:hypothetical protein
MSSIQSKSASTRLARYAARYSRLKAELQELGYVCVGSVQSRRLPCGNPGCRCHTAEHYRHGPYHYWTRKVGGKTVSAALTADQLALYRTWIENNRTLSRIVRQMREVSARAIELTAGPRTR